MDGDGARAGFKQIVSERKQADLGTLGRGRMVITAPTATSVQVAEEAPATVFGFKLASINSTLTNSTVTGPAGAPPAMSVDFTGLPNAGETVQFRFTLPDGTSETHHADRDGLGDARAERVHDRRRRRPRPPPICRPR